MNKFFVTTPIYYANDKPHVGHAYTTLAADVLARYWRKKIGANNVFFLTGTDEHGQKIAESAQKAGKTPRDHVDLLVPRFKEAFDGLNVESDIFMRTTERGHIEYAQKFLTDLYNNGDIYKDVYEGYYCVGCESYKTDSEINEGKCMDHPNVFCEKRSEENYFFRLTKYVSDVIKVIESGELNIMPEKRKNEVLARLKSSDLRDLSISRPSVAWGVPVPWDETHTVYVWTEALLNYASALEIKKVPSFWSPDVQLMGKEILWFHGAIWPALLIAYGKELPKTIFAHGWFTFDGQKMSKTLGNVIDPVELVKDWGVDATRYLILSAVKFGEDGDLQVSKFKDIYEGDLANSLGNLLQRTITLINRAEIKIEPSEQKNEQVEKAIEELRLDEGLKLIWEIIRSANKSLEDTRPWELIKQIDKKGELKEVLESTYRQLETIATSLEPYLPETSEKIFEQLKSGKAEVLFPRKG